MKLFSALFAVSALAALWTGAPLAASPQVAAEKPASAVVQTAALAQDEATAVAPKGEEARAQELIGRLSKAYRHLDGVTVRFAKTPKGEEAVAYYTDGEIVINTEHTVSIDEILAHEVWHIIDYRDNGQLDWGENLPPSDSSDYLSR
jgi:hypothetical protein